MSKYERDTDDFDGETPQPPKSLNDLFSDWCCETQAPVWDDRLVDLMEDGDMQMQFLESMGLPEDTELTDEPFYPQGASNDNT